MKRFTDLLYALDESTRAAERTALIETYLRDAEPADAAWAVWLLLGNRPKRAVPVRTLCAWARQETDTPEWLFEESAGVVGDLAETAALLLPPPSEPTDASLHHWIESRLLPLGQLERSAQRDAAVAAWRELDPWQRWVWNRLVCGTFRPGVKRVTVIRALAQVSGAGERAIAHRLDGGWEPDAEAYSALIAGKSETGARQYPFRARESVSDDTLPADLIDWRATLWYDGVHVQLVRRADRTYLWSHTGELLTDAFPEIDAAASLLPDGTVLEGELVAVDGRDVCDRAQLERRLGRRASAKLVREAPCAVLLRDLLEEGGEDVRALDYEERAARLKRVVGSGGGGRLRVLEPHHADLDGLSRLRSTARAHGASGVLLLPAAALTEDRPALLWPAEPHRVRAVLLYAQAGNGPGAAVHGELTFALRDGEDWVPFARLDALAPDSGLARGAVRKLDAWARRNTVEKFGPVRHVKPEEVFDLEFDDISASSRHRSGVTLRGVRVRAWDADADVATVDSLGVLHALLDS